MSASDHRATRSLSIRTLRRLEEIESIRDFWESVQRHPWTDIDYFVSHLTTEEGFVRPHIVVLEKSGQPVAMVVGRIKDQAIGWRIGPATPLRSRARVLRAATGGIMGDSSDANSREIVRELIACLGRSEADMVYLHHIGYESPLLTHATQMPGVLSRDRFIRPAGRWTLDIPGSFEKFRRSRSKSVRRNLNYYSNVIQREFGDDLDIVCYRDPGELDRLIRDTGHVARLTYHQRMGVGFKDSPEVRHLLSHAAEAGWLRAYVLYIGQEPRAFWHGLEYGQTYFTRDTGFDPAMRDFRLGTFLLARIIAELCAANGVERVDFGTMDAEYKRHFGSSREQYASVYIFARDLKGLRLSLMRATTGTAERVVRSVAGTGRTREWGRKVWRRARSMA